MIWLYDESDKSEGFLEIINTDTNSTTAETNLDIDVNLAPSPRLITTLGDSVSQLALDPGGTENSMVSGL